MIKIIDKKDIISPLKKIKYSGPFEKDVNPFPWLSETIDLSKQKNFFETKVTDYQNAGALDDDF